MKPTSLLHLIMNVISMLYQANAFSMKMIPIDSPDLQILPNNFTLKERHHLLHKISLSRVHQSNVRNSRMGINSINSKLSRAYNSYYVTQFSIGAPENPFISTVILDISYNQTWIQCTSCSPCFNLTNTFDIGKSSTFALVYPPDPRCALIDYNEGLCWFEATFGPGHVKGYMGQDTVSFNDSGEYFKNIAFGCAIENYNVTFGGNDTKETPNVIAGVLGLAPVGQKSFMYQLEQEIKGVFTYCLRPNGKTSDLVFGDKAQIRGSVAKHVKTINMHPGTGYHLSLTSIVLDGKRLAIDPSIFELDRREHTRGFFIDPSSPYTVLTHTAYEILRNATIDYFYKSYSWRPLSSSRNIFDLCYSEIPDTKKSQRYPPLAFYFKKANEEHLNGEVEMIFDSANVFGDTGIKEGFCMQILPTPNSKDGPSFFRAYQQTNFQFLFDIENMVLKFIPKIC